MNVDKSAGGTYVVKAMVVVKEELEDTAECLARIIGEKTEPSGVSGSQGRVSVPTGVLTTGPELEDDDKSGSSIDVVGGTPMTKEEFRGVKVGKAGKGMFDIDEMDSDQERDTDDELKEPEIEMPQIERAAYLVEKDVVEQEVSKQELDVDKVIVNAPEQEEEPVKKIQAEEEEELPVKPKGRRSREKSTEEEEVEPVVKPQGRKSRAKIREEETPDKPKGRKSRGKSPEEEEEEEAHVKPKTRKSRVKATAEKKEEEPATRSRKRETVKVAHRQPKPVRTSLSFKPATASGKVEEKEFDWDLPMNEDDKEAAAAVGGKKRKSTRGAGKTKPKKIEVQLDSEDEEVSEPEELIGLVTKRARVTAVPRAAISPLKKKSAPKKKVASKKKKAKTPAMDVYDFPDEMSDLGESQEFKKEEDETCGGLLKKKAPTPRRAAASTAKLDVQGIFGDGIPISLTCQGAEDEADAQTKHDLAVDLAEKERVASIEKKERAVRGKAEERAARAEETKRVAQAKAAERTSKSDEKERAAREKAQDRMSIKREVDDQQDEKEMAYSPPPSPPYRPVSLEKEEPVSTDLDVEDVFGKGICIQINLYVRRV
jgi:hypothetical protein